MCDGLGEFLASVRVVPSTVPSGTDSLKDIQPAAA